MSSITPTGNHHQTYAPDEQLLSQYNSVSAGTALGWIGQSWGLFKKDFLIWIAFAILSFVVMLVLAFIPIIGQLITVFLTPVMLAGTAYAARQVHRGNKLQFGDYFQGFKKNFASLLLLALIQIGAYIALTTFIIILLVIFGFAGFVSFSDFAQIEANPLGFILGSIAYILVLALFFILGILATIMAFVFAPILILLNNVSAIESIKISFKGCLRNILPGFVFLVLMLFLTILAIIPLGLGLLILIPIYYIAVYLAYQQIFLKK